MSSPSPKSVPPGPRARTRRRRHLNLRAAVVLATLAVVGIPAFFLFKGYQDRHQGSSLLAQARELLKREPPRSDLALGYLTRYLELKPDDIEALDLKGKVLFDLIRNPDQAASALPIHDQVVRADAKYERREARRRQVQLNLLLKQNQTAYTLASDLVGGETADARAKAADVRAKAAEPEDYRLLGRTLIALADAGTDDGLWKRAIVEFEKAQEGEPGNVEGARYLTYLYQNHGDDPGRAVRVLDDLLAHAETPAARAEARVARYDYFAGADRPEAQAELEEAVRLAPEDTNIRLKAAMDALRRGQTEAARRHIAAIPPEKRNEATVAAGAELRIRENDLDEAIREWREGLKLTGGTSDALTWRLAYVLLRLGRLDEAAPLVEQYHRLTDGAEPSLRAVFLDALVDLKAGRPAKAIEKLEPIRLRFEGEAGGRGSAEGQSLAAEVNFTLGQAYDAEGRNPQATAQGQAPDPYRRALEFYRKAALLVQGTKGLRWSEPWVEAAGLLIRQDRLEEAAAELQAGLAAIPDDPNLLLTLGRLRLTQQARLPKERRSWAELERLMAQAERSLPGSADLVKLRVPYLVTVGRLDEAARLLAAATAAEARPQDPDLWITQAEVLRRLGQPDRALEALDRGTAAVGERAAFRIARAQILDAQGRYGPARDALAEGATRVPPDQRATLLRALGDLYRKQNAPVAALKAYADGAKLSPGDPQPRLQVLEMALDLGDEAEVKASTAALQGAGGLPAQMARALVLLKDRPDQDTKARAARLDEAQGVIDNIIKEYDGRPIGYLMRGRLREQQGRPDAAIEAYTEAHKRNGGIEALRPLFVLMVKEKKFKDLKALRDKLAPGEVTPELEQLAAGMALALGEKGQAEEMVEQLVRGDPQGLDRRILQARFLTALGKPGDAESVLRNLVQQRPEELEPRVALMMFYLSQDQKPKAAEVVERIKELARVDRPEFVWAGCHLALGDTARAGEYYREALRKWPDDPDVRRRAIAFFRVTGQAEAAESFLRGVLKADPGQGWAVRELAQILVARPNDPAAWDEALQMVGERAKDSDTPEDRLIRANVLARSDDPARRGEAVRILEGFLADRPGSAGAVAHDLLARIHLAAGRLPKALEHAEASAAQGTDPNAIAFYAELLLRNEQPEEAGRQVDRLAQIESNLGPRVLTLRTQALQAQGKTGEAVALLEGAFAGLEKRPDGDATGRRILDLLGSLGQADAAEKVGRRLAQLWPRSAYAMAPILVRRGQVAQAMAACQATADAGNLADAATTAVALVSSRAPGADDPPRLKQADALMDAALKQQPESLVLLFARASIRRLQGRFDEAARAYRDLLKRAPDNSITLNNLAWTLSEDLGQPEEGLRQIDAAIARQGRDPSLLDTRGVILTRLGRLPEAIADLEASAQASPSAVTDYHLARACHKAGRDDEFRKYRDRAKGAGLTEGQLQPGERKEMAELVSR